MRHRLLCCSDTHGVVPPVVDERGAVAWLHGGDICRGAEAADLHSDDDPLQDPSLKPVAEWFSSRSVPIYHVVGNHDVVDVYHVARWAKNITGLIVPIAGGLFVAGTGWHGERYYELPFEADLKRSCDSVLRMARRLLASRDRVILLTHFPPRYIETHEVANNVDGGGVWFDCVRDVVAQLNVVAVVQGHNHRWFGDVQHVRVANRNVLLANPGPTGCAITVDLTSGPTELDEL